MRFSGRTHPGRRGGRNEDAIGWDDAKGLWFVADGMGGHASGDVASRTVKETLLANAAETDLRVSLLKAHEAVRETAALTTASNNMGSTVVAAHIAAGCAHVGWVGDSRAYLWRNGLLSLLTRDHSYLEVLRAEQNLSESQMRGHPDRNLVTQTLGMGTPVPSVMNTSLRQGDCVLLCSDGLNDELEDREIADVLRSHPSPESAVEALIGAALNNGGRDNVSAILIEYDGPSGPRLPGGRGLSDLSTRAQNARTILPIMTGMIAAMTAAFLWWWFFGR